MKKQTETLYGVARKSTVLHDRLYRSYGEAQAAMDRAEDAMEAAGLEPDVRLVEVDAETTYSAPRAAKTPENSTPGNGPAETGATGEGVTFPASGVWGDDGSASPIVTVGPSDPAPTTEQEQANPADLPTPDVTTDPANIENTETQDTDTETVKD